MTVSFERRCHDTQRLSFPKCNMGVALTTRLIAHRSRSGRPEFYLYHHIYHVTPLDFDRIYNLIMFLLINALTVATNSPYYARISAMATSCTSLVDTPLCLILLFRKLITVGIHCSINTHKTSLVANAYAI